MRTRATAFDLLSACQCEGTSTNRARQQASADVPWAQRPPKPGHPPPPLHNCPAPPVAVPAAVPCLAVLPVAEEQGGGEGVQGPALRRVGTGPELVQIRAGTVLELFLQP